MRMGSPDFDEEEEIPLKEETSFTSSLSSPTKGGLTHHSNRNSHAFSFETTTAAVLFCIRALRSSKADEPDPWSEVFHMLSTPEENEDFWWSFNLTGIEL
ncbi:hypothetical protein AAHE18_02G171300 [Arachis hypogaea]